ncbi:hypothetical protein ACFC0E_46400, partial [Streptomyces sp. NPDC056190]
MTAPTTASVVSRTLYFGPPLTEAAAPTAGRAADTDSSAALRDRKEAHAAGLPYVKSADLSRLRITQAKRTEERAWLADVSAVVLQQSLRDLDTAYKNFFDSIKG